jgi:hypothetical protein
VSTCAIASPLGFGLTVGMIGLLSVTVSLADQAAFVRSTPLGSTVGPPVLDRGVTPGDDCSDRCQVAPQQDPGKIEAPRSKSTGPGQACLMPASVRDRERANRGGQCDAHLLLRYARLYLLDAGAAAKRYPWAGSWSGESHPNIWLNKATSISRDAPKMATPAR